MRTNRHGGVKAASIAEENLATVSNCDTASAPAQDFADDPIWSVLTVDLHRTRRIARINGIIFRECVLIEPATETYRILA